ncbi:MAG: helix-turn-helix transcriptional regulator [Candidatus Thiodiazotropha sp.]
MSFGNRIQIRLEEIGKKPADMARYLNISEASLSAWFSGDTKSLKADTCLGAAKFLGVNPYWMYFGTGRKTGTLTREQNEWLEFGDQLTPERRQQIIDLFSPDDPPTPPQKLRTTAKSAPKSKKNRAA